MQTLKGVAAAAIITVLMSSTSAMAAGITLDNIVASWINPNPNVTINNDATGGTSTARWGTPADTNQSGYDFTPTQPQPTAEYAFGSTFELGDFKHLNFPITGTSLLSIDLLITYDVTLDDGVNQASKTGLSSLFSFTHFETPNDGSPCAAGGSQPCPDLVTVLNNVGSNDTISLGGVDYQLFVTGFDIPSGNKFLTLEDKSNTAPLMATISDKDPIPPVPLPAALPMLLSAFGLAGFLARRRKAA